MEGLRCLVLLVGVVMSSVDCRYRDFVIKPDSLSNCNGQSRGCCLQPLNIDFRKSFGGQFESILWPKQVNIGRCVGPCDGSGAVINGPCNNSTSVCCAPIKYEDFSILLYQGNNELVMKTIRGVKISECGCK